MLRRRNVRGGCLDAVLSDLRDHAAAHLDDLIAAFHAESDTRVRVLVLAEIAEVGAPSAFSILAQALTGADEDLRAWGARGLYRLNTREARAVLADARRHRWSDAAE